MQTTFNYTKYIDKNPLQKLLIGNFFNALLGSLKNLKADRILDVGCGEGVGLNHLQSKNIGKYLEGIDYSKEALILAKKFYPSLKFRQGDIYKLPYRENEFDLIICSEVLEHLDKPEKAVGEMKRVTNKFLLFSVPNEPIFRAANFFRGRYIKNFGNTPGHVNHWSKSSFIDFLRSQEIKIISVKTPFPWLLVLGSK